MSILYDKMEVNEICQHMTGQVPVERDRERVVVSGIVQKKRIQESHPMGPGKLWAWEEVESLVEWEEVTVRVPG